MPYARFDDRYDDNKKIRRALKREPTAVAMHAMAITYCNRHNTNGELDADWIEEKLASMPHKPRQRAAILEVLLDLRLFERVDSETYLVHDFLDWNLSREQRKALGEQGRKGGKSRSGGSSPSGSGGSSQGLSKGSSGGLSTPFATPTPTPTPRTSPPIERGSTGQAEHARLSHKLASNILANDPKAKVDPDSAAWQSAIRLTCERDGRALAEVERVIDWLPSDHPDAAFWRTVVLSAPTLRKRFTQLTAKMNASQVSHISRRDRVVSDQNSYLKYYEDEGAA